MAKVTQVLSGTDDYLNQFGIHNEFDEIGRVISTDYWESDVCKNGFFFMAFNKGVYSLLVPEEGKSMLDELKSYIPTSVVISRSVYKGKPDNYEIMFDDMSNRPSAWWRRFPPKPTLNMSIAGLYLPWNI